MKKTLLISFSIAILATVGVGFARAGVGTAVDLTVMSLEVPSSLSGSAPGSVELGDSVLVKAKIENIGNAAVSGYVVDVYLLNGSANGGSVNKKVYSQSYKNSLPANKPVIFKYTIPTSKIVEGKNTVTVKVTDKTTKNDDADVYPDSNLANNEVSSTIIVNKANAEIKNASAATPDLTVASLNFPDKVVLGSGILVKALIKDLNNSNVRSYKITTSVLNSENNKEIVDLRSFDSGTIGRDGVIYMLGIESSKFKLGNNAVTVRVDDIDGNDVKLSNNSFSRAVLVTNFQQEKEVWRSNRQNMLMNLKSEKDNFIKNFKEKFTTEKCTDIQTNVQNSIAKFDVKKEKHISVYENLVNRINKFIERSDENKLDTELINGHLIELQVKIDKFKEDYTAYAEKLNESQALTCGHSEGEFKGILLEAKNLLKLVHADAADIRAYIKSTIITDLEILNAKLSVATNNN